MPVRVLHVVTYMCRGGLETFIMNYYRKIDRSKVQFDFLVHREFEADYDREIQDLGGRIYRIPRLNPFSPVYLSKLDAFFAEHKEYKIVHSHLDCMAGIPLKYAKKHGVPVRIAHSHNNNQDKNLKYPIKLVYRSQIPKYATHLFACSKEAGDWMFLGRTYQIINNAIEASKYIFSPQIRTRVRREFGISEEQFVIGHVGRFAPQKNHMFIVDIFSKVKKRKSNTILLLVGDGELRGNIEKQAEYCGVRDSVIFTGVRSDVPELMQAMDCFVLPSLYEGLGIVSIEAQTSGLPCLVSDRVPNECSITDLVEHISLEEGADKWAAQILNARGETRCSRENETAKAGYDINSNASELQNYYLKQWEKVT